MQAQKDAFQHFNIAFLGCLQFQSYEKKPYPKAKTLIEFRQKSAISDIGRLAVFETQTYVGTKSTNGDLSEMAVLA